MKRNRGLFTIFTIISLITLNAGLKCRNPSQSPYDQDMEYAVRQCVRQMIANTTDQKETGLYSTIREWERPHREDAGYFRPSRDVAKENQENPPWLRERRPRPNRYGSEDREDDNFGFNGDRRRFRGRERPHTVNQQTQHDKETRFNPNRRPIFQPEPNFNKQVDSKLNEIEPCMIYCVFQELKMLDDWGQLDKQAVMSQMTHGLRDRDLRDFLQFAIDDCLNELQRNEDRRRQNERPEACKMVKNFAICLEERGRQVCEDWDEPIGERREGEKKTTEPLPNQERDKPKDGFKKGLKNSIRG